MGVPAVPAWADRAESLQGGDPRSLLPRSSGSSWEPLTCGSLPFLSSHTVSQKDQHFHFQPGERQERDSSVQLKKQLKA